MIPALCLPFTPFKSMFTMTPARCLPFDPLQFNVGLSIPRSIRSKTHMMSATALSFMLSSTLNPGGEGGPASGGGSAGRVVNIPSEFSVRIISPGHGLV